MKNIPFSFFVINIFSALFLLPNSVQAKVTVLSDDYFIIEHEVNVPLEAVNAYQLLGKPSQWWSSAHTWSGNAKNLSLPLKAGACFCEVWNKNSVMHAQVITAMPGELLRLQGGLGPLQEMAVNAVLSYSLKKQQAGTRVLMSYRVSGNTKNKLAAIAPIVDKVMGEQLEGFSKVASK